MGEAKYHEKYIPGLKRVVLFCNQCGEYGGMEEDNGKEYFNCSNPICPEQME